MKTLKQYLPKGTFVIVVDRLTLTQQRDVVAADARAGSTSVQLSSSVCDLNGYHLYVRATD